jgi:hypothetical protein
MIEAVMFTIFVLAGLWGAVGMVVCITLGNLLCGGTSTDHVSVFKSSVSTFAVAMVLLYVFMI